MLILFNAVSVFYHVHMNYFKSLVEYEVRGGVTSAGLFFAALRSGAILPLAKMNKNILSRDSACTGWIGFTNLTGIANQLSSKFLCLNHITEVFQSQNGRKVKTVKKLQVQFALLSFFSFALNVLKIHFLNQPLTMSDVALVCTQFPAKIGRVLDI